MLSVCYVFIVVCCLSYCNTLPTGFKGFADSCAIANDFVWTRLHGALCGFGDIKHKTIEHVSS